MSKFEDLYNFANDEQREAIDAIEGPVMVVAGPGTGKTQTLGMRIANILRQTQVNPENILCLTYTDKASINMRERLEKFIGQTAYKVRIETFHSFCNFLISSNLEKFPRLSDVDNNLDDLEKFEIIKSLINSKEIDHALFNIKDQDTYVSDVKDRISELKREGFSPDDFDKVVKSEKRYISQTLSAYKKFRDIRVNKMTEGDLKELLEVLGDGSTEEAVYTLGVVELARESSGDFKSIKAGVDRIYKILSNPKYIEKLEGLAEIYREYENFLQDHGVYDYEDMIMLVLERLKLDESFLADVRETYQYILIDEYQDTNSAQNELIEIIAEGVLNPNIFVVGDDDQSIFRFQGASLENLLFFKSKYPETKLIQLTKNYRSTKEIVNTAIKIIEESSNRLEDEIEGFNKIITPQNNDPGRIVFNSYETNQDEAIFVAKEIKAELEKSKDSQIGVIFSKNSFLEEYMETFSKLGIDYQSTQSPNPLKDEHVTNLITILEFLPKFENDFLGRILLFPYFELDRFEVFKATNYSYKKRYDLLSVITSRELLSEAGVEDTGLFEFSKMLAELNAIVLSQKAYTALPEILKVSGIENYLLKNQEFESLFRINKLYEYIKKQQRKNKDFNLQDLLRKIDLADYYRVKLFGENVPKSDVRVTLTTVHKAKGLEFDSVYIPLFLERLWEKNEGKRKLLSLPSSIIQRDYPAQRLDEKIRLIYVALTRAKKNLTISYPIYDNSGKQNTRSMFWGLLSGTEEEKGRLTVKEKIEVLSQKTEFSSKAQDLVLDNLKSYVLSPTSFVSYRNCPHCFFINKVLKLPEPISTLNAYGSAMHTSLNKFLSKYRRTKKLPTVDFLTELYDIEINKQPLDQIDIEKFAELGKLYLTSFHKNKLDSMNETSLPELDFSKYKIRVNNIPITGKIDRIDFPTPGTNRINILDYKTGRYRSEKISREKKGDYYIQLLFYNLLIKNYPKHNWDVGKSQIVYLETDNKSGEPIKDVSMEVTPDDINWLIKELEIVYNSILNLEFSQKGENCYTTHLHNIDIKF